VPKRARPKSSPKAELKLKPQPQERLLNRELSWLEFNARVLELAGDPDVPLLERVKFCSIVASNLDEFFMVRVAGLMGQTTATTRVRSVDGLTPAETLDLVRTRVTQLTSASSNVWSRDLQPALADEGIVVCTIGDCDESELRTLTERFEREIFPVLTPLAVGPGQRFPYISGLSLSLGVFVRDPETSEERFARVKAPEGLPRFIQIGGLFIPLEQVIAHFLPRLFPQMEIVERAAFRVTRDADFEVSDEADDLLDAVQSELSRRRFGEVVRVEVSGSMSSRMLARIQEALTVKSDQVYPIKVLLDMADLDEIADLDRPDLKDDVWLPAQPPRLAGALGRDLFDEIGRADVLVHHPYDSFNTTFERFVRVGAKDPDVTALKTTVYRTSGDSPIVPALVEAAEDGKQSVCLVELKARFDERRNIEWSRALERAGVHVVYGFSNLKIHAKMTLVVRHEGDSLRRYVHVGTGNYHALTARRYEDFGLFTADEEIGADVADLFNHLTGFGRPQRFRKLLVAPFGLRGRLIEHIRAVGQAAKAGKHARIRIKVNSLTDPAIVDALYRAASEGAAVEIVARSICALRPGVKGLSERIRVRSILGRFLEHSRLFVFEAGDESTYLIGSADLMPRNLDHRLEILAPVEDARARQELAAVLDALMADNAQAWELASDGTWSRVRPEKGERSRPAQTVLMRRARARARRAGLRRNA
jgi:polyphosphate kinase